MNKKAEQQELFPAGSQQITSSLVIDLPYGWQLVKLNDVVVQMRLGGSYENAESHSGVPVIKMGNIGRGNIVLDKLQYLPVNAEHNKQDTLSAGDLLFNTRNTLDLVGKVAIWREELPYAVHDSNLMRIYFDKEQVHSTAFMNYVFNSAYGIRQLRAFAIGTTSVAAIYNRDLLHFKILLPPLPEQRKIAAILNTWDTAIDTTEKLIAAKEQLKKGLMQQLLTGKIRFREFRGEKWKKREFSEIAAIIKDHYDPRKNTGKYRCVELEHMEQGTGFLLGYTYTDRQISIKNTFKAGHILFGKLRPYLRKYWLASFDGMCSSEIWVLQHQRKLVENMFLFYLIQSSVFIQACAVTSGTKMPRADWTFVSEMPFQIPSLINQQKIASVLSTCDREIQLLKAELGALRRQKKGLMQQLLTGRVRVNS